MASQGSARAGDASSARAAAANDGTGPGGAVFLMLLQGAPALTVADFQFG